MDVRWRGWPRQFPHSGEGVGEQRPDETPAILDGADVVCERRKYDDVVGDEAAGLVASAPGIREAQGDMRIDTAA